MERKMPVGRPKAADKKRAVTFMAAGSKVDKAEQRAIKKKTTLQKELEIFLYDYASR